MSKNINENLIEYDDIEVYNMVMSGTLARFPNNFWEGVDSYGTAKTLTKYLFEKILKWTIDEIKTNNLSEAFFENRLGGMIKCLFDNSVYKAIINAYPELEEWFIIHEREQRNNQGKEYSTGFISSRIFYTDEELIQKLQDKTKELNRIPIIREMKNPEGSVYIGRFGTWRKALVAAELIEDIFKDVDDSEEKKYEFELIFKKFVLENDRLPTKEEISNIMSEGELITHFNSISGLYNYLNNSYDKDELIHILKHKAKKLNRLPTNRDMKIPRAIKFVEVFGSWDKSLEVAKLK